MRSIPALVAALQLAAPVLAQAPPPLPVQGVPFLRLIWARVADLNGELGSVECAEFSPDGRLLASATKYSNEIAVWRVAMTQEEFSSNSIRWLWE